MRNQFSDKTIKSMYGIGYLGEGKYRSKTKTYAIWRHILRRCYGKEEKFKSWHNCLVDERWHNYQVFAEWYENNYIDGFHLDKDILIKGNKIYGPDTCCFVPNMINTLFRNIDKINKYPIGIKFDPRRNTYNANISRWGKSYFLGSSKDLTEAFSFSKLGREDYLKELAEEWKPQLDIKTYNALINWKVEITD